MHNILSLIRYVLDHNIRFSQRTKEYNFATKARIDKQNKH